MRLLPIALASLLLLPAALALAPSAAAAQPPPQCIGSSCCFAPCEPLVGVCVDDVTAESCFREGWICVGFSYQVPQCVRHPAAIDCTEICNVCSTMDCTIECGSACEVEMAESRPPEPQCFYWYWEMDLGPVRYVQRDSCHNEVYVLGERVK